ncbi:MAG TPA: hypothetical protein GXX31_00790 [Methanothermobacter sp.]|nr:hypothetical protein [Methanothermobacter sp.]
MKSKNERILTGAYQSPPKKKHFGNEKIIAVQTQIKLKGCAELKNLSRPFLEKPDRIIVWVSSENPNDNAHSPSIGGVL